MSQSLYDPFLGSRFIFDTNLLFLYVEREKMSYFCTLSRSYYRNVYVYMIFT